MTDNAEEDECLAATRKLIGDRSADPQVRAAAARWLTAHAALEALGIEEKRAFQSGVRLDHSIPEIVALLNIVGERILKMVRRHEQNRESVSTADLTAEFRRATSQFGEVLTRSWR